MRDTMRLLFRLETIAPLFIAILLLGTLWKQTWQHVAARSQPGSVLSRLAGAAAYQW